MFCTRFYDLDLKVKVTVRSNVAQTSFFYNPLLFQRNLIHILVQNLAQISVLHPRMFCTRCYDLYLKVKVTLRSSSAKILIFYNPWPFKRNLMHINFPNFYLICQQMSLFIFYAFDLNVKVTVRSKGIFQLVIFLILLTGQFWHINSNIYIYTRVDVKISVLTLTARSRLPSGKDQSRL